MEEESYESTNIHTKWLENIYEQIKNIQYMERLAMEGCTSLIEYFQIPFSMQRIIIPDTQYKNIRFIVLEMQILISNLSPVLKDRKAYYETRLKVIADSIDNRKLFLKEVKSNNQLVSIEPTPFMNTTIKFLFKLKSDIINDIGDILYLKEEEDKNRKKW